jgi:hypothetical protein
VATTKRAHNFVYKDDGRGGIYVVCGPCAVTSPVFDIKDGRDELVKWCNQHSGFTVRRGSHADQVVPVY